MPYPGLRPFEAEDQPLFFGREAQIGAMLRQLEDHKFCAVVGSSGSGKSSLVRAGLLPAVREGFLLEDKNWLILMIKPGHQPYLRLASELSAAMGPPDSASDPRKQNTAAGENPILAMLRKTDCGFLDALNRLRVSNKTMVVVDQFEEFFAFRRENTRAEEVASRDESAAFVNMLLRSCSDASARVWVVLTMRSDFIGDCEAFLGLPEVISQSQFLVPRLDRRQMEDAIKLPGEVTGAAFKPFTFEEGLVNRIINDAGDRPDQLPLMQHALMRTWKLAAQGHTLNGAPVELKHGDYDTAGKIEQALSLHADSAWNQIKHDANKADIARSLFLLLCDVSPDGQITRRRPQLSEVKAVTGASVVEIGDIIRLFKEDDRNFLLLNEQISSDAYVDISHEALLRQWHLFATDWLAEERNDVFDLKLLTGLSIDKSGGLLSRGQVDRLRPWRKKVSAEWAQRYVSRAEWIRALKFYDDSQREVERLARKKRNNVLLIGATLLLATLVSWVLMFRARQARDTAEEAKGVAEAAQQKLEDTNKELKDTNTELDNEKKKAVQLARQEKEARLALENAIGSAKAQALWHPLLFSDPAARASENNALLSLAKADPKIRETFLQQIITHESLAKRFVLNPDAVVAAAVGLSPKIRKSLSNAIPPTQGEKNTSVEIKLARELLTVFLNAGPMDRLIAEIKASRDRNRLLALGQRLAVMASRLPDTQGTVNRLLAEIKTSGDPNQRDALAQGLAAMAPKLSDTEAASIIDPLLAAIKGTTNSVSLRGLGQALGVVTGKLPDKQAAMVVDRLLAEIKTSRDPDQHQALAQGLATVVPKLSDTQAASIFDPLLAAIKGTTNSVSLRGLGQALGAVTGKLPDKQAAMVVDRLLEEIKTSRDPDQHQALAQGLATMVPKLSDTEVTSIIDTLLAAIKSTTNSVSLRGLGQALGIVTGKLPDKQAAMVLDRLEEIKASGDPNQRHAFAQGLAALAPKLSDTQAASIFDSLLAAIKGTTNSVSLRGLGQALGAVTGKLPDKQAAMVVDRLLEEIKTSRDPDQHQALAQGLATMVPKLSDTEVTSIIDTLLAAIKSTTDAGLLRALGQSLFAMVPKLSDTEVTSIIDTLLAAIKSTTDAGLLRALGQSLLVIMPKLSDRQAVATIDTLFAVIKGLPDPEQSRAIQQEFAYFEQRFQASQAFAALGDGLAAATGKLSDRQAAVPIFHQLLAQIKTAPSTRQIDAFGQGLVVLAEKIADTQPAGSIADSLIGAIKDTVNQAQFRVLGQGLRRLGGKIPDNQAVSLAEKLIEAIKRTVNPGQIQSFDQGLTEVAFRISVKLEATVMARTLILAIQKAQDAAQIDVFGRALVPIAARMKPSEALTRDLIEVLKYPNVPREDLLESMRKQFPNMPPAEKGLWATVDWISGKRFPGVDLDASPTSVAESTQALLE
jgi:energy-coupling factor transporter ATP-binding protein EcfA2